MDQQNQWQTILDLSAAENYVQKGTIQEKKCFQKGEVAVKE